MTDSSAITNKWDQRYQHKTRAGDPCWLLRNNLHLLPSTGSSLDVACGLGANALCLAAQGLQSHGWDISTVALEKLTEFAQQQSLAVTTLQRDIEQQPPAANSFDVIVVSHFLYRPIMADLVAALKPGGLLFYQTFNQNKTTAAGPSSATYLLTPNELLTLLSPLQLHFYREDGRTGQLDSGLRDCSYFIGKKI
ncbi:bifunctional 2-polyprenyl-6-hydroxyphenol methylase/3-demethylubiquinol 3-O-methyltransferase UbiG [Oceanicoccus sp. KOV_DT_Chl]|uniref:class I SAM-dependent methyltransferase n=1 Tax=Oceanicoccus sp. KOV_DT_Chl TaxID=1904639 RepID=UPI000C7B086E|nr:class I SAM-dependent methyltransferase [Oceanicoccus sp. KOV_DT_Chl]